MLSAASRSMRLSFVKAIFNVGLIPYFSQLSSAVEMRSGSDSSNCTHLIFWNPMQAGTFYRLKGAVAKQVIHSKTGADSNETATCLTVTPCFAVEHLCSVFH